MTPRQVDTAQPLSLCVPKVSQLAGTFSLLLGTSVLAGFWFGVTRIAQPIPVLPEMMPNTAVWLVLLGSSALLLGSRNISWPRLWLAKALVLVVILHSGTTLAEHLLSHDLGVDEILIPSGRSAPGPAAALFMLAGALLTLDFRLAMRIGLPEILAGGAALVALLAVAGYVYGATSLYASTAVPTGMAPHTTVAALLLSAGVLCLRPERAPMSLLMSTGAGGLVVRRLLVGAFAIPLLGLLVNLGHRGSLYGQPFAAALVAVIGTAVAVGLLLATGRALDRLGAARTASERALAEREERLRDLIAQASDGVFVANLDGGLIEVNDAGCQMLRYRREEIIGTTMKDLIPDFDVPRLESTSAALLQGDIHIDEWILKRRDGTYLPVEISMKILPGERWQGLVRDISARKDADRASDAVAESATGSAQSSMDAVLRTFVMEAQFVADAEYAAVGIAGDVHYPIYRWVSAGLPPERTVLIGPSPRSVGLPEFATNQDSTIRVADVRQHPAFAALPPHDALVTSLLAVPIRSRGHVIGNLYLANKRGAGEFTIADERAIERIAERAGTIIETARLYQIEGLQRAWLQATIEQMPEGVVLVDGTGAIQVENRAIQTFAHDTGQLDRMGLPERYDLRLPSGEPVSPEDRPRTRALIDGVTTRRRNLQLRHPDGRMVPMLVSAAPVFDAEGRPSGAVTIYQDISTIKELERLREEWSSLVAHDLRQPLGVILLEAAALARMLGDYSVEECRKVVDRIRHSTKRLNKMIDDLLDVSLIEGRHLTLERSETDLASWLDEALERVAPLAPGHPVELRTQVRPARAFIDPARIEQVLGNLISNAAKYGETHAQITIGLAQHGTQFEVAITSRGRGIDPAEMPNLFQRFSRTASTQGGSVHGFGLGLYICKGLVEAHGGRIWAESAPGETTTFYFTIPSSPETLHAVVSGRDSAHDGA